MSTHGEIEMAIDKAAQRFHVGHPLVALAAVVGPALGVAAHLLHRGGVQDLVDLALAAAVDPMALPVAGGHLEGCDPSEGRELAVGGEPGRIAHDRDQGGGTDPPDPHDGGQGGAVGGQSVVELTLDLFDRLVVATQIGQQVGHDLTALVSDRVSGVAGDSAQDSGDLVG